MRIHNVLVVAAAFFAISLIASDYAFAQTEARTFGRGVSGSPTVIAGEQPVAQATARRPGQILNLTDFQRWSGLQSRATRPGTHVIRNQQDWSNIWKTTNDGKPPRDLQPGEMAIAIFIGPKPSEGYSPGIVSVNRDGENLYVTYVLNKPRDVEAAGGVKTSPWLIQLIPPASGRVRFISVVSAAGQ